MRASDVLKMNLTEDELRRWHINMDEASNKGVCTPIHKGVLLNVKEFNLCDIINLSFIWDNTNEGYEYWKKISRRKELINARCLKKVTL